MPGTEVTQKAEPFLDGLYFGEAPRWHGGRLWYSDFFDHSVFSIGPKGTDRRKECELLTQPSGMGWLPDGRLLVVSMIDRKVLRQERDGSLVPHGDLEPWATFHGNDMVVDQRGRAYVGNFGFDLDAFYEGKSEPSTTSMVRIDPDGTAHEAVNDLFFPNGTVITPDGKTLVVAESMKGCLSAFDVTTTTGELSKRREWASMPGCAPDGICLDANGCIWVANAVGKECLLVKEGGEVLQTIETSEFCYACMLGGEDRRTLYMMTAQSSESKAARAGRNGHIEQFRTAIPGAGLP